MKMDILEKNMKAMEKWYPKFVELLREKWEEYKPNSEFVVCCQESWDGYPIYSVNTNGRKLYLNGKRNVTKTLENLDEKIGEFTREAPIILIGIGSAIYLKRVCMKAPKESLIILYEPSLDIFMKTISEIDLSKEISDRLIAFIVDSINHEELRPIIDRLVNTSTLQFLKTEIHPGYQELFSKKVLDCIKILKDKKDAVFIGLNTEIKFQNALAVNQLANMRYLLEGYNSASLMEAICYNEVAILVSAGPSLNENIDILKKAKNKAFILAVDTAMKPLIKAGIRPDAFVMIDSAKPTKLLDIDEIRDVPIIVPATANYALIEKQRNKKIFYFDGHYLAQGAYMAAGKILPEAASAGSVSTSAFSLLYKMGFKKVILVGQDLAFTNNKSHVDGAHQDKMPEIDTSKYIKVKGNLEEKVPTNEVFKSFLEWFKTYIKGASEHANFQVINSTAGGAYIEGTEWMDLEQAIEKYCKDEVNFEKRIAQMESCFSPEERAKIEHYLKDIPKGLIRIERNSEELLKTYGKIEKMCYNPQLNQSNYLKYLKKVKKLTKQIEREPIYDLVSTTMALQNYLVTSESLYEGNDMRDDGKAIASQGKNFCDILKCCTKQLHGIVEDIYKDI